MSIHIEVSIVEHPFKLCTICNDALGVLKVQFEPGTKKSMSTFTCKDHIGKTMFMVGEGIVRLWNEEKEQKGNG